MRRDALAVLLFSALTSVACQSLVPPVPAVLVRADDGSLEKVKASLAQALGMAKIELGPGDPTRDPVLSVLPPRPGPLDDRSLVLPETFTLVISEGACVAIRENTGERVPLSGVACRPAPGP